MKISIFKKKTSIKKFVVSYLLSQSQPPGSSKSVYFVLVTLTAAAVGEPSTVTTVTTFINLSNSKPKTQRA